MFDYRNRRLINRFGFYCSMLFVLATWSAVSAAPPYPSTLEDHVTMYEISSYKLFQHDRDEYKRRLERGKLALKRMKKHGGRSAKAATTLWFETATYSKDIADQLPGLPALAYLKDVDNKAMVARTDPSEEPTPETVADTANEATEEAVNSPSQSIASTVASLKKAISDSQNETDEEAESAANDELASADTPDQTSDSYDAMAETKIAVSELAAIPELAAAPELTSDAPELAAAIPGNGDNAILNDEESADSEANEIGSSELPFDGLVVDEESAELESVESVPFDQVASTESTLSEKASAYNATAEEIQSEALVALGGDGSDLMQVVEKIEAAADSRSGIQAQIDLSSSIHPIQAMSDLKPVIKELHKGIFKFPKSPDGLSFETAVDMLERLQDVEAQLEELTTK